MLRLRGFSDVFLAQFFGNVVQNVRYCDLERLVDFVNFNNSVSLRFLCGFLSFFLCVFALRFSSWHCSFHELFLCGIALRFSVRYPVTFFCVILRFPTFFSAILRSVFLCDTALCLTLRYCVTFSVRYCVFLCFPGRYCVFLRFSVRHCFTRFLVSHCCYIPNTVVTALCLTNGDNIFLQFISS